MAEWLGRILGLIALLTLLLAACDNNPVRDTRPHAPGVTDSTVRVGSSLALSGHAAFLGLQTLVGAKAYIGHVNAQGGVHGRTIELIAYDDAYDPPRCLANTQKLLVEDDVFALSCYVGTPTTLKIIPLINQAKVPLVGMFTGANALREPFNRYLINVRPSYYQETRAAVDDLVDELGLTRIAVFYQYDAYGFDGLTGAELALKAHGLTPVARGSYTRGTTNVAEGVQRIAESGAEAVIMIGTYQSCSAFVLAARKQDFNPVFFSVSFAGADELAHRLSGQDDAVVLMSQVVPPPTARDAEGERYAALLARYAPHERPNVINYEGYLNAKVLVEGLQRAGRDLTRESFIDAINTLQDFPLREQGGLEVGFGPKDHQGLETIYMTRLEQGQFRLVRDWKALRAALAEKAP